MSRRGPLRTKLVRCGLIVGLIMVSYYCNNYFARTGGNIPGNIDDQTIRKKLPRIPNILIAGTQKAGTSWLFYYLQQHEDICPPKPMGADYPDSSSKEVHFFDHDNRFSQGLEFYQRCWEHCQRNSSFIMDATPNYLLYPERIRQVYDEQGATADLKIILILREPTSRELAAYRMGMNHIISPNKHKDRPTAKTVIDNKGDILGFEDYINKKYHPKYWHLWRKWALRPGLSLYGPVLKRWFDAFNREQILVLVFDELQSNTTAFAERTRQFLGLSSSIPLQFPPAVNSNANKTVSSFPPPPCSEQTTVARLFEQSNSQLYDLLERYPGPEMEQRPFPKFEFRCK